MSPRSAVGRIGTSGSIRIYSKHTMEEKDDTGYNPEEESSQRIIPMPYANRLLKTEDDIVTEIKQITDTLVVLDEQRHSHAARRRKLITQLYDSGLTLDEIAEKVGISRWRVEACLPEDYPRERQ